MPEYVEKFPICRIAAPEIPARTNMDYDAMKELMESVGARGLYQPIVLRRCAPDFAPGELVPLEKMPQHLRALAIGAPNPYSKPLPAVADGESMPWWAEISAGHRRWCAHVLLGVSAIRALVFDASELDMEDVRLDENLQREDLNPADQAIYIGELWERWKIPVEEMARRLHRSVAWIDQRYALLVGNQDVFVALRSGQINFSVATELNKIKDEKWCLYYLGQAVGCGATREMVHQWVVMCRAATENWTKDVLAIETPPPPTEVAMAKTVCVICDRDEEWGPLEFVPMHRRHIKEFERMKVESEANKLGGGQNGE